MSKSVCRDRSSNSRSNHTISGDCTLGSRSTTLVSCSNGSRGGCGLIMAITMEGKTRRTRGTVRVFALMTLICTGCVQSGNTAASRAGTPVDRGVPNFRVVDQGVYRGGQPTEAGWAYLKSLGVKTVVK